ncbi:MAG: aminopeptidase P family protein [Nitrospirae bacterium]|nr:aminopeptidase P family protein [Nitrospirota bacterium]
MASTARVLIAASELDSDLFYATRFLAPDPFTYVEIRGRKTLLLNELEVDRARREAAVDEVLCTTDLLRKGQKGSLVPLVNFLRRHQARVVEVPSTFPIAHARHLERRGVRVRCKPSALFFEERMTKTADEIEAIRETQRATEAAVADALDLLHRARIVDGRIEHEGQTVTCEMLRTRMDLFLHERGYLAANTIVASGADGCDPHCRGTGPVRPHQSLVIDIFPRSLRTRYYSDMTRTVVKGHPSPELKRLYQTVLDGQRMGLGAVRAGADGAKIHRAILDYFTHKGYKTGLKDGRMQGFFHGTGHGLGLDIHEPPRLSRLGQQLAENNVVTVEPGLYYPAIGAVRIEDTVVVRGGDSENLTSFHKILEIE